MNDTEHGQDHVGSLAEELSKLMGVLADPGGRSQASSGDDAGTQESRQPDHGHHIANGSASCQVCPVCQTIAFVRSASPEVREHLTASATALTTAARGLIDAVAAHQNQQRPTRTGEDERGERGAGVENIDLSEDDSWD